MPYGGSVYIITNKHHTTLYIGATAELANRIMEHREGKYPKSFSAKYNLYKLVYFEHYGFIEEAITREKQLKKWNRSKKEKLINDFNPEWRDLFEEIV